MSRMSASLLVAAVGFLSTACNTTGKGAQAKENEGSAQDRADHGCKVILRSSQLTQGGTCDWLFSVDVEPSLAERLQVGDVQVRYNVNDGEWASIPARFSTSPTHNNFRRYTANVGSCLGGGGPSLRVRAVAFVKTSEGQLFDHNFEEGDVGSVLADRSKNWDLEGLSPHCK